METFCKRTKFDVQSLSPIPELMHLNGFDQLCPSANGVAGWQVKLRHGLGSSGSAIGNLLSNQCTSPILCTGFCCCSTRRARTSPSASLCNRPVDCNWTVCALPEDTLLSNSWAHTERARWSHCGSTEHVNVRHRGHKRCCHLNVSPPFQSITMWTVESTPRL